MNQTGIKAKVNVEEKRHQLSKEFYRAGLHYILVLDEWIVTHKQNPEMKKDIAIARSRKRLLETFLHRLYPDEFADTSSFAE